MRPVLDTLRDAERFHRRLLSACVRADARAAQGSPTGVSIVIIGAGATGVELAAEIRHTTAAHAAYGLEHLDARRDIRLTLLEAAPRIPAAVIRTRCGGRHRIAAATGRRGVAPTSG
jgi:NADH dehydrogenase